jgi:Putative phage tail protein
MNKVIVYFKHNQLENTYKVTDYIVSNGTLLINFITSNSLNKSSISINVNGLYYSEIEASEYILKNNDVVKIEVLSLDPISTIITSISGYLAAHAVVAFFVQFAATAALSLIIASITKSKNKSGSNSLQNDKKENSLQTYGISGARNDTKPYSPLKLGIGSIRVMPDYNSSAFVNYKVDTATPIFVSNKTAFVEAGINYIGGGMAAYGLLPLHTQNFYIGGANQVSYDATFYGASRTYKEPGKDILYTAPYTYVVYTMTETPISGANQGIVTTTLPMLTTFEDFLDTVGYPLIINGVQTPAWIHSTPYVDNTPSIDMSSSNPIPYPNGSGTLNVIKYFGYYKFITKKRLVQILNLGFGDCDASNFLASKIKIDNFKGVKITKALFDNKSTYFGGALAAQKYEQSTYISYSATSQYNINPNINLIVNTLIATNRLVSNTVAANNTLRFIRRQEHGGGQHDYTFTTSSDQGISQTSSTANQYFKHFEAISNTTYIGGYPTNVEVLTGGELRRTNNEIQQPTDFFAGWIIRSGGRGIYAIEINFTGQLFRLNITSQIVEHKVTLDIRYRQKQSGTQTLPDSTWIILDSAYVLKNDSTGPYGKTAFFEVTTNFDAIEIAIRKNETDTSDSNITEALSVESINLFNKQTHYYPAQNRFSIEIEASEQLNGNIADHISCLVNYKTWVYGAAGIQSTDMPSINGIGWGWIHTRNPAYWYLYFALGGYLNEDTPAIHPLYNKGWHLGQHLSNKQRIFGCGEQVANIDLVRIVEWASYCDTHNLKVDMEISGTSNTYDTLAQIASVGRAKPVRRLNGKLSVVFHDINSPIKAEFGKSNILANTLKTIYKNKRNSDEYIVTYVDRDDDFSAKSVRFAVPLVQNPINVVNVDIVGITTKDQAERECRLACANEFYNKEIKEFETGLQYMSIEVGDVIRLADMTDSGRLVSLTINNGLVTEITLSCELAFGIGTPYFISITDAIGNLSQHNCLILDKNRLQILTSWLASNAPEVINETGTINSASNYLNSLPSDFTFLGSVDNAIAGKYRILQISPNSTSAKITAAREIAEFYACEYGLSNATGIPSQTQDIVATIENMAIAKDENGYRLHWDNIECTGADLSISVNGGAAGIIAVDSNYINIAYPVGTSLSISAIPRNISTVILQQSKVFNFIV